LFGVLGGAREPLAWILGSKGFWKVELYSPPGVLVPRPDTETLVEAALSWLPEGEERFVADVGSGTGAVGLSILVARPKAKLYATDLSPEAIAATRENASRLGLIERVGVLRGPLLSPIPAGRPIDLVVSNPPYIPSAQIATLAPEIREHEPRLALDGGPDGLDVYRALIPVGAARARVGVLVEVGDGQAAEVGALMQAAGLREVQTWRDLSGIERVVGARR
jgi:release factor glutamine methyltransferase